MQGLLYVGGMMAFAAFWSWQEGKINEEVARLADLPEGHTHLLAASAASLRRIELLLAILGAVAVGFFALH